MMDGQQEKTLDRVNEAVGETKRKHLRPSECRSHMRKTLAKEFQEIVDGFVEAAKKGSCPHVKLATELLKPIRKSSPRKKGPMETYVEQMNRQYLEKERLEKGGLDRERLSGE